MAGMEVMPVTPALPLSSALASPVTQLSPAQFLPQADAPSGDGVVAMGHQGTWCYNRLYLMPWSTGFPGQRFFMRLYAWRPLSNGPLPTQSGTLWMPQLLAEMLCTISNLGGRRGFNIPENGRFCDSVSLTAGYLGATGYINAAGAGSNMIAQVSCEAAGCRYVQFDFAPADFPVGMNSLFAKF